MRDFADLSQLLRERGVGSAAIERLLDELEDHAEDLSAEYVRNGESPESARRLALARLGNAADIADAASEQLALAAWWKRYPRIAVLAYPLLCAVALPVAPIVAGIEHRVVIARWVACVMAGGTATALLFLLLGKLTTSL